MLEVPAIAFYVGTTAMVIVSVFLMVFLFYLIQAARVVISIARFLEEEGRKVRGKVEEFRRAVRFLSGLFHK